MFLQYHKRKLLETRPVIWFIDLFTERSI